MHSNNGDSDANSFCGCNILSHVYLDIQEFAYHQQSVSGPCKIHAYFSIASEQKVH